MAEDTSVHVAVRIRPQLAHEKIDLCGICTTVTPGEPQLVLGKERAFTYDFVFDTHSDQESVYTTCVHSLIEGCLDGYNATILAYGQTGSGKTYSMGTGFDVRVPAEEQGIIPRAVAHLFRAIERRRKQAEDNNNMPPDFKMSAQFMELYNEEIYDLFDTMRELGKKSNVKVHEDSLGGIYTVGVTTQDVTTQEETMKALQKGALSRTTASTCMNAQSSRSHAIFTLHIEQRRLIQSSQENGDDSEQHAEVNDFDFESLRAKLHFVDLAGSERLKRTGATGDRAKEGISINCGLLALGNVISALGDLTRKASHVPYRDSKLTRLLQDSLGGNSKTVMIACVSPTDRDFMETLNTLKYANRARNIKNKVVVNQDKASQVIMQLRQEIQKLQIELNEFKQGKRYVTDDGEVAMNDVHHENTLLKAESDKLRLRLKAAQDTINAQAERLVELQAKALVYQTNGIVKQSSASEGEEGQSAELQTEESQMESIIKEYLKEIEDLRSQLLQSESLSHQQPLSPFRRISHERLNMASIREAVSLTSALSPGSRMFHFDATNPRKDSLDDVLLEAKKDVEKDMEKLRQKEMKLVRSTTQKQNGSLSEDANTTEDEFDSGEDGESGGEDDNVSDSEDVEDDEQLHQEVESTQSDIAELSNEISIKEKLLFQLEHSKRQMETMREQYEHKMMTLQEKIKRTECERDQVLQNLSSKEQGAEGAKQKVKEDYETKLKSLQKEMKQLKTAKKQHQALLRANAQNEQQLKTLRSDVQEMKKQKVQLMRKLREEATIHKEHEAKRSKEVAQLKKQQRQRENIIRNLEVDQKRREVVLKRRNEEIAALRRQKNPERTRVNQSHQQQRQPQAHGLVRQTVVTNVDKPIRRLKSEHKHVRKPSSLYSSVGSRRKWRAIESKMSELIVQKQAISAMEDDMDRWIQERQRLHSELKENTTKLDESKINEEAPAVVDDLQEQHESLSSNLEFANANIQERESDIMTMMDAKGDGELTSLMTGLINKCSISEAKYIMERFVNANVDIGVQLAHERAHKHRLEEQLKAREEQLKCQEELLLQKAGQWDGEIHSTHSLEIRSLMNKLSDDSPSHQDQSSGDCVSDESSQGGSLPPPESTESLHNSMEESQQVYRQLMAIVSKKDKIRRRTATPSELLFSLQTSDIYSSGSESSQSTSLNTKPQQPPITEKDETNEKPPDAKLMPPPASLPPRLLQDSELDVTSTTQRRNSESEPSKSNSPPSSLSPHLSGSGVKSNGSMGHVFERLAVTRELASGSEGKIVTMKQGETRRDRCLMCTHLIQGHMSAVLTLCVNGSMLYTGSQDRTVRVWDLEREQEVVCIAGQPSSVTKVVYCHQTRTLLTGSQSQIKVWDVRESDFKCVRTLGQSISDKGWKGGTSSDAVHDMALDGTGSYLYSATSSSSSVKIWDLRKFSTIGKLSGHSAPVSCLLIDEDNSRTTGWVFTGSRDHHVRGFDINRGCPDIQQPPGFTFKPPHYDGVQSLAIAGRTLFSGSRDYSIKQWDVETHELKQAVNAAHSHWVTAMMRLPESDVIVSGCRSGVIKLWMAHNCQPLGETSGHKFPINAMAPCNGHILTASSDRTVKLWKVRDDIMSP